MYMKKIATTILLASSVGSFSATAQKIAYVDLQEIMVSMPEYKNASTEMESYNKQLEGELIKLNDEFKKKYEAFQKDAETPGKLSGTMKEFRQSELQKLQQSVQEFQQTAQEDARKKETELVKPIIDKAKSVIAQVAKEGGYSYVFDSNTAGMLYKPEGDNLTSSIKKKLGIAEPAPQANPTAPKPAGGK